MSIDNSFKEFCDKGEQRRRMEAGGRNEVKRGTVFGIGDITACLCAAGEDQ